ncbi:SDR family oxidoreductase [Myroides marinus]|uniref:SDR family oxidoreductase n=1 Tax=Myroides marinus TaxID=703342 RepID=UPI0025777166|nr:SDR family NAD(P)-dependent oxidoreductase [Myroides marinus]MDM1367187.1 SDR family NAD(P)-dependent oxidoreductase [Myroides marinus]
MKTVFITGGTSGIGWALAQRYLSAGYRVGIGSRTPDKEGHDFTPYTHLFVYSVDATDLTALKDVIHTFSQGQLDILIAGAGNYTDSALEHISWQETNAMIDNNIKATLNTLEVARELMQNKGGTIACIASISTFLDYEEATIYTRCKQAVLAITKAYRRAYRDKGIKVIAIHPGYVATPRLMELNSDDLSKKQYVITPTKAAEIIYQGITQGKQLIVFPKKMYRLIRCLQLLPKGILQRIMHKKAKWQKQN